MDYLYMQYMNLKQQENVQEQPAITISQKNIPLFGLKNGIWGKKAQKKGFLAKTRSLWGDFLGGALMKYLS